MSENFDNLSPRLAIRLRSLSAPPSPDIEHLSEADFEKYRADSKLHISPKAQKQFNDLLEFAKARQRLEHAKQDLAKQKQKPDLLAGWEAAIASLSLDEVRKRLRECLSMPGIETAVYARKLEENNEADLRSLLLDLERTKNAEGTDNSGTGRSV